MKIVRRVVLEILLLVALCICATGVMKIFDIIYGLGYENIWGIGFKVGFTARIILLVWQIWNKGEALWKRNCKKNIVQ